MRAVDRAGIDPVVDAGYPMLDLPSALEHLDRGACGKVVVAVGRQEPGNM